MKNFILHLIERKGLNPEWTLLHLLEHISDEQARLFCEKHELSVTTSSPVRTVEEAIAELYERRMTEVNARMDEEI